MDHSVGVPIMWAALDKAAKRLKKIARLEKMAAAAATAKYLDFDPYRFPSTKTKIHLL